MEDLSIPFELQVEFEQPAGWLGTGDIETAFATFVQRGAVALLVGTGGFVTAHLAPIIRGMWR